MNRYRRGRRQSDFQKAEWRRTDYSRGGNIGGTDNSLSAGTIFNISTSSSSEVNRFRGAFEIGHVVTDSDDTSTDPSHFATLWVAIGVTADDITSSESSETYTETNARVWRRIRSMVSTNLPTTYRFELPNVILREDETLWGAIWQQGLPSSGLEIHYRFNFRGWYQRHDY